MSKYLISTCETYRMDSEAEVLKEIEAAKNDRQFILHKYTSERKDVKSKGEIIDSYYKVTFTKVFDDIKNPEGETVVEYKNGAF